MTTLAAAAQAVGLDFGFAWQNNMRDGSVAYFYDISSYQLIRMNDIVCGDGYVIPLVFRPRVSAAGTKGGAQF